MKTGVSRVRALPAAVLFALAAAVPAFAAQDQAELLSFSSGREVTLRAVEQALREADPREQLDWTFTVRPSLLHRRYLDERGGELVRPRVSATLQIRFGEKPLDAVRREARLERALRAHDRAGRLEVRSALLAHAELLLAQDAFRTAREALDDLPADASALERTSKELTLNKAEAALSSARREAAGYGVSGEAVWRSLRFAAPPVPDIAELSAHRLQELAVAEAEVRLLQAGGAGIVKDFRLGLGWRTDSTELDLETGLMAGRPGLRLGSIHPGGRERLEFRLSA
ncbi:MAG TPA: hypothetical protein VK092_08150, partial [Deinococcales bacterium]|nr:hypothetical protein [Deinococcales bacterium]